MKIPNIPMPSDQNKQLQEIIKLQEQLINIQDKIVSRKSHIAALEPPKKPELLEMAPVNTIDILLTEDLEALNIYVTKLLLYRTRLKTAETELQELNKQLYTFKSNIYCKRCEAGIC